MGKFRADEIPRTTADSSLTTPELKNVRGPVPSATVWIVKGQVVGKAENGGAVSRFPTTSAAASGVLRRRESAALRARRHADVPRELWR